jgi:hypothetical protein
MDIKTKGKRHSKARRERDRVIYVASSLARNFLFDGHQAIEIIDIGNALFNIHKKAMKNNLISVGQHKKAISLLACLQAILNDHRRNRGVELGYTASPFEFAGFSFGLFLLKDRKESPQYDLAFLDSFVYII